MMTDGIWEAAEGESMFGVGRSLEIVEANRNLPANAIAQKLRSSALSFANDVQLDDMTVVIVKVC